MAANTGGYPETTQTHADHDLSFPIAHSVDISFAQQLGAWVGERRGEQIIQPCEFLLRPDGSIAASVYANTSLGRMLPEAIWHFVDNLKRK